MNDNSTRCRAAWVDPIAIMADYRKRNMRTYLIDGQPVQAYKHPNGGGLVTADSWVDSDCYLDSLTIVRDNSRVWRGSIVTGCVITNSVVDFTVATMTEIIDENLVGTKVHGCVDDGDGGGLHFRAHTDWTCFANYLIEERERREAALRREAARA